MRRSNCLAAAAARAWAAWRDLLFVLRPCRFSVFVVAFGGALLLAVPQGREMTVRLGDEPLKQSLWFCVAVALWAFQSWYWARFVLDATFGADRNVAASVRRRPDRIRTLVDHVPRVVAGLSYAIAIAACLWSEPRNFAVAGVLAAMGIVFYAGLVVRRDLTGVVARWLGGAARRWLERRDPSGRYEALTPLSKAVFWIGFAAAVAWFAWACIDPVGMGWTLGASAVPFIGFASIVPVGSMAVYWARAGGTARVDDEADRQNDPRVGYPVVTLFAALAVLFSTWVDNHGVRPFDAAPRATATPTADAPHAPTTPASAAEAWLRGSAGTRDAPADLVVVAAAGGGIRAAYWTATVLGALQDCAPALRRKLFAISGVSGGSLGAVTFATLLSQNALRAAPPCPADGKAEFAAGPYEAAAQRVLSHDFLAPAVASLLFPDLMQRLLPWDLLPDRAAGLEKGWERAWGVAGLDADTWSGHAFDDLWRDAKGPVPALLLNGTSVESGRRIVTSNLKIDPAVFRDAVDFFEAFGGRAVRASTAAHNSARFTYVSPAGRVNDAMRIVDGGYFENFGAKTASEVLGAALAQSRRAGVAVRPIVIVISNSPQMRPSELPPDSVGSHCPACAPDPKPGLTFASEALSPLLALLHTRDAHGTRAAHDLHDAAAAAGGRFYHFRLCPDRQAPDPALGWVLSKASERSMQRQLRAPDACGNREQFDELVRLLRR